MKIHKTFESFHHKWVVDDVERREDEILSIKLTNGYELVAEEDTGGEDAIFIINGTKLKTGDEISFNVRPNHYNELWGIESININGKDYPAEVASEGGNTGTYLVYKKQR